MRRRGVFASASLTVVTSALFFLFLLQPESTSARNIVVKYVLTPTQGRIPSGQRVEYTTSRVPAPTTYNPLIDPQTRPVLIQAPLRVATCKPKQKVARGRCRDIW